MKGKGIGKAALLFASVGSLLTVSALLYQDFGKDENAKQGQNLNVQTSKSSEVNSLINEETYAYLDGNLMLVNPTHAVPEGYAPVLETVQGDYKMDQTAATYMKRMIAAAKNDGINLWIVSAYRSKEYQQGLFDQNVSSLIQTGLTSDAAVKETAANVAVPGTSEHQTGLAADIFCSEWTGGITDDFAQTLSYAWLMKHCAEYGFIERYPLGKTAVTGIVYEPWHFRYVGTDVATIIMKQGITLEEYLGVK